jgi:hypothetical protein
MGGGGGSGIIVAGSSGGIMGSGGRVGLGGETTTESTDGASSGGGSTGSSDAVSLPIDAGSDVPQTSTVDSQSSACSLGNSVDLIADFAMDAGLNPAQGLSGAFFVFGDGLGTFDPAKQVNQGYPIDSTMGNPTCSGPGSFHTKATGFRNWGAAIAANFVARPDGGAYQQTFDASMHKGISFWAKGAAAISNVKVSFPDVYTDAGANPTAIDPTVPPCVYVPGSANNCSPYMVKFADPQFPAYGAYQIDTTWKRFDILFADTDQDQYNPGYHTSADKLDVHHLTSMTIEVAAGYVGGNPTANDFEMWIDDVSFIE